MPPNCSTPKAEQKGREQLFSGLQEELVIFLSRECRKSFSIFTLRKTATNSITEVITYNDL